MSNTSNRIGWIDGVKGLACLIVFVHHFCLGFFPVTYYGIGYATMQTSLMEFKIAYTPLGVILNGNFMVCIFFVLSAFLLTKQVISIIDRGDNVTSKISKIAVKRYPRLMIPAAIAAIIYYLLIYLANFLNINFSGFETKHSFLGMLKSVLFTMWVQEDSSVIGAYWMMHALLLGSFIAILYGIIAGSNLKKWQIWAAYVLGVIFLGTIKHYFAAIVLGSLMAYISSKTNIIEKIRQKKGLCLTLGIVLFFGGLYLGGYPSFTKAYDYSINYYPMFSREFMDRPAIFECVHIAAAFIYCSSFFFFDAAAKVFSSKVMSWLGRVSFSIYLLHAIVLDLTAHQVVRILTDAGMTYRTSYFVTLPIITVILLLLSWIYNITVEKYTTKLLNKLF